MWKLFSGRWAVLGEKYHWFTAMKLVLSWQLKPSISSDSPLCLHTHPFTHICCCTCCLLLLSIAVQSYLLFRCSSMSTTRVTRCQYFSLANDSVLAFPVAVLLLKCWRCAKRTTESNPRPPPLSAFGTATCARSLSGSFSLLQAAIPRQRLRSV